jgi:hypothetical protein
MEANPKSISGQFYKKINALYDRALIGETGLHYLNPTFGNIVWSFSEAMYLDCVLNFDTFFEEAEVFLTSFNLRGDIFKDLLAYQKALIKKPFAESGKLALSYDFYSYFYNIYLRNKKDLREQRNITTFKVEKVFDNWVDYARENVWWGRNQNRNIISDIEVSYL